MTTEVDAVEEVMEEAKLFDASLEGALDELAGIRIPGRWGAWFARVPLHQLGKDERVRTAERFLGELRATIHRFRQTCERLPDHVRETLVDAGVGPDGFAKLTADRRLETNKGATTQEDVRAVIEEARRRAELVIAALERTAGFR